MSDGNPKRTTHVMPPYLPTVLPLFPLANHVLLPGLPRPYHIFEPRYREMIADLLLRKEDDRWLAIPCVKGSPLENDLAPPIHDVATAALLVAHEKLADGRYNIVVYGMDRCRLEEIDSDRPYRMAKLLALPDEDPLDRSFSLSSAVEILGQLAARHAAARGASPQAFKLVRDDEDQHLFVYRLGALLIARTRDRLRFLAGRDVKERVDVLYEVLMESMVPDDDGEKGIFLA